MKNICKSKNKKFVDKVCKGLIEMGANQIKSEFPTYNIFELETIVGKTVIKVELENVHCYTVFSKFEDVERAKEKFDCNPYTGKYNLHLSNSNHIDDVIDLALIMFKNTLV